MFKNVLLLLFVLFPTEEQNNYAQIFGDDYSKAVLFMKKNDLKISEIASNYQISKKELTAILFPENIRYSLFRDYFETKVLSMAYIALGSNMVDFSIGCFQMKPSFIEKIDSLLLLDSLLFRKYSKLNYNSQNNISYREERIVRLQKLDYQLAYACAFVDLVVKKYHLEEMDIKKKIIFLASAYNHGFEHSAANIWAYSKKAFFPYGATFPGKQYVYADIAWDYYKTVN